MPDNDENYKAYLAKQQENALEAASTLGFYKRHPELPPPDKDYRKYLEAVIKKQTDPYNKQPVSIDKMPVVNKQIDPNFSSPEYLESPSIHPVEASRTNRQMTNYQNKGKQMDPKLAQQLLALHDAGHIQIHPDNIPLVQRNAAPVPAEVQDIQRPMIDALKNNPNDDFYNQIDREQAAKRQYIQDIAQSMKGALGPAPEQFTAPPPTPNKQFSDVESPAMTPELEQERFHSNVVSKLKTTSPDIDYIYKI